MAKYARAKHDGYVMHFNAEMRPENFDFFDHDGPIPEFISDLPAFLSGKNDPEITAKPVKKKNEPQLLRKADGSPA